MILSAAYLQQVAAAEKRMESYHDYLIAEGWDWDGMDGYSAPSPEAFDAAGRWWDEYTVHLISH